MQKITSVIGNKVMDTFKDRRFELATPEVMRCHVYPNMHRQSFPVQRHVVCHPGLSHRWLK
mgnify:FL=1|jgi:hypothetical protein